MVTASTLTLVFIRFSAIVGRALHPVHVSTTLIGADATSRE